MPIEKVSPIKQETGGDDVDYLNTPADPNEDALNVRGLYIQADTGNDTSVVLSRDNLGNMTFQDPNAGVYTLSALSAGGSGITATQHKTLRQLIHLAEEGGPFEGFASGAYQETLPSSSPFPTSIIWWTSAAKTSKIVEETVTYNSNKTINSDEWKVYDTDGSTVLATVTDVVSYSGIFELSRTRTIV
jgi:hypothetical protein